METLLKWSLQNKSPNLEALEHVQVLLAELEVLGQQAERLHMVELPGSEEAQDELVVCSQEADVRPRHDHIPYLRNQNRPQSRGTSFNGPENLRNFFLLTRRNDLGNKMFLLSGLRFPGFGLYSGFLG